MILWLLVILNVIILIDIIITWRSLKKYLKRIDTGLDNIEVAIDDLVGTTVMALTSAKRELEEKLEEINNNTRAALEKLYELKYKKYIDVPKDQELEIELKDED